MTDERKHEIVPTIAAPVAQEPFGIWHQGDTEEESDFFLFKDSGDVSCPNCIKLYTAPPDQSAEVSMTPAASIFKDEVARLNAEVERLRDHGKKLQSLVDAGLDLCERKDKRIAELERQQAVLVEALEEARDEVVGWAAYASEYFQQKHNLKGYVEKLDATLASVKGNA